jgi:xylulokinase
MTARNLILALDLGTSSLKAQGFDESGQALASASAAYPTARPATGAAEQDPDDWWRATGEVIAELRRQPGFGRSQIAAIGLSGQMHGVVARDAKGRVIRPCLTWADERGGVQLDSLANRVDPAQILGITGNPLNAGFSAAKLDWLRANEPDAWRSVATILFPKDDLRSRLTGEFATDPSDASGSLLLDLGTRTWSKMLTDAWDIDVATLPTILPSAAVAGSLRQRAADELGLEVGIPVVVGAGDTPAAALGLAVDSERDGVGMLGIGTAAQLLVTGPTPMTDPLGRLGALCHAAPDVWCAMAAVLDGGSALAWISSVVGGPDDSIARLLAEAELVPIGAEGLTFLPHLSGERTPGMDASARASFVGLTARHGRAHLVRAILEGVAYSLREGLEVLRDTGIAPTTLRMAGTPAGSIAWVRILADVLGVDIRLSDTVQASARGAGLLAATAVDPAAATAWQETRGRSWDVVEPSTAGRTRYDDGFERYLQLREALKEGGLDRTRGMTCDPR